MFYLDEEKHIVNANSRSVITMWLGLLQLPLLFI